MNAPAGMQLRRIQVGMTIGHPLPRQTAMTMSEPTPPPRSPPSAPRQVALMPTATTIEGVCREATADLGRLIGILTADVPEQGSVPDRTDPDVGRKDLGDVVDAQARHLRASGHDVEVTCTARDVPPAIVDTAGRILEEAVANVIRHAGGGSRCEIAVTTSSQHLDVRVVNTVADTAGGATSSTHLGLVSLAERVRLLKGMFSAGPEPDGRWVLSAHVPCVRLSMAVYPSPPSSPRRKKPTPRPTNSACALRTKRRRCGAARSPLGTLI